VQEKEKLSKKKLEVSNKLYAGKVILDKDMEDLLKDSSPWKQHRIK
jgi:hypothetical protein